MSREEKFRDAFREEAIELLVQLEEVVLSLEHEPKSQELIHRLFRIMHTIKGSGSMFGFSEIADFTHHLENALDLVRLGKHSITPEFINLLLCSRDLMQEMLDTNSQSLETSEQADRILTTLKGWQGQRLPEKVPASGSQTKSEPSDQVAYRLRIKLGPNVMAGGLDPLCLLQELHSMGECAISAQTDLVPPLSEIDPELCYFYWDAAINTTASLEDLRGIFLFVEDESRISITRLEHDPPEDALNHKKLGEILVERGDISEEQVRNVLARQKRVGELMVEAGFISQDKVDSALVEQKIVGDLRNSSLQSNTIRVSTEKLDRLMNLVGEMVITQAQLNQVSNQCQIQDIASPVENMERLTNELRDCTLNIRMLPVEVTFNKFRRLVRDLTASLGKNADLVTQGGETELDKTVIERIHDPLIHLIRNSIDHGIETPEERRKAGKPEKGTIRLTAGQSGGEVIISIEDDGAGLNRNEIRAKGIEQNLINESDTLSDAQIYNLIFKPGFSTVSTVTDVSGRGVGMDIVKREITRLRGSVSLESKRNQGTRISIHLPLTLAIIEGLLTVTETNHYVIPLTFIQECIELTSRDISRTHGRHVIQLRGETIPYIRLREFFALGHGQQKYDVEYVVIAVVEGKRLGLVVDHIIGDHQAVIKSLGKMYEHTEGISGATILGDGTIALILDVRQLMECARREEAEMFIRV
ncbi:MAG: chemotaxis protein CheW [bacterium]